MSIGYLQLDGWAGRTSTPVEVIGMTRKKYRIEALEDMRLPRKRFIRKGEVMLVPHHAVRDNCELCKGKKGGVPGNENRINNQLVCDYCHAATLKAQP